MQPNEMKDKHCIMPTAIAPTSEVSEIRIVLWVKLTAMQLECVQVVPILGMHTYTHHAIGDQA